MNQAVREKLRPSRAEAKAATRKLLLDAARTEFTTVGYHGATLDDIAARAGFTKGALYWHFANKQAIFLALIGEAIEQNLRTIDAIITADSDPAAIRQRLGQWIDGIDDREALPQFGVELEIEARRDETFRAIHQAMIGKHEVALGGFLERYFAAVGETPMFPIAELAAMLITIFKGFALCRQNRPDGPVTSGKIVRILLDMPIA